MNHPLKPRILCNVDDEPPVVELLQKYLESTGDFRVEVETTAIKAVARAQTFRPDLVLLDVNMPGQDGFALARSFRHEPWLRHKPILFFSGMSDLEEPLRKAWRGGPTEVSRKRGVAGA